MRTSGWQDSQYSEIYLNYHGALSYSASYLGSHGLLSFKIVLGPPIAVQTESGV